MSFSWCNMTGLFFMAIFIVGIVRSSSIVIPRTVVFEGVSGPALPIINSNESRPDIFPRNFRATTAEFIDKALQIQMNMDTGADVAGRRTVHTLRMSGLSSARMSGSAQFTSAEFRTVALYIFRKRQQDFLDSTLSNKRTHSETFAQHQKMLLQKILENPIYSVDLRQEPHGFIQDDVAVSWFSPRDWSLKGIDDFAEISTIRRKVLNATASQYPHLVRFFSVRTDSDDENIISKSPVDILPYHVADEEHQVHLTAWTLLNDIGKSISTQERISPHYYHNGEIESHVVHNPINYRYIPAVDHLVPSSRAVAQFEDLLKQVDKQEHVLLDVVDDLTTRYHLDPLTISTRPWIHFHCAQGDGRTTTFLVLADCYFNRHNPSITTNDIIWRQALLGGIDLAKIPSNWKAEFYRERLRFVKQKCEEYQNS